MYMYDSECMCQLYLVCIYKRRELFAIVKIRLTNSLRLLQFFYVETD